ncbi:DMT family transporter [Halorussus ruber]|uniref:DMT family transporter n=1 Tax=Halorussus ruber TaxID=1126238 RepID=UPI001091AD85|nr:EamA family transporter [Halorussus ruber]
MSRYRNLVLFVALGAIWGGAYPAIKTGLQYVSPVLYAAIRYDVASVLMVGYVAYSTDYWRPRTRADWVNVALGGVLIIAAYNGFLFVGETSIPSAVAGILVGLMPILTTVFSGALLPDTDLTSAGVVGVLLGFAGILVISRPDPSNLLSSDVFGQLFVLGAAASMALGSVLTERFDADQPAVTMEAWSMLVGSVVLHAAAFARPGGSVEFTAELVVMIAYLSVLSSAVAYFIYFDLLDRVGAFEMNFIAYAAAAFGALFGWLFLSEQITAYTVGGYLCILGGFLLLKKDEIRDGVADYRTRARRAD